MIRNPLRIRGMTLVELLVAITVFGLVITMLYSGLYTSGKTWNSTTRQFDDNDTLRLELGFLRKHLAQAVPLLAYYGENKSLIFSGEADRITFVSNLPGHRGGGGLHLLSLGLQQTGDHSRLVLIYHPVTAGLLANIDIFPETAESVIILEDINSITMRYYGSRENDALTQWHDAWIETGSLPQFIQLQITPGEPGQYFPPLTIKTRLKVVSDQPQLIYFMNDVELPPDIANRGKTFPADIALDKKVRTTATIRARP